MHWVVKECKINSMKIILGIQILNRSIYLISIYQWITQMKFDLFHYCLWLGYIVKSLGLWVSFRWTKLLCQTYHRLMIIRLFPLYYKVCIYFVSYISLLDLYSFYGILKMRLDCRIVDPNKTDLYHHCPLGCSNLKIIIL